MESDLNHQGACKEGFIAFKNVSCLSPLNCILFWLFGDNEESSYNDGNAYEQVKILIEIYRGL